jgi:ribosomal protein S18 acetylase RimI-like enzyme
MLVENFRGDFEALAEIMEASWSLNNEPALLFTEEFLRSAFEYPGSSFALAPALYTDDGIDGFCAAFPRNVRMGGRDFRLAVMTFLTASRRLRGAGHGVELWGETVERARAAGYGGAINFCVEGDDMQRMMPWAAEFFRSNTREIYRVEYLSRFLRPAAEKEIARATDAEIEMFLDLANTSLPDLPLARTWTREEAVWQCRDRGGAITVSLENEGRRGLLTGYIITVTGNPPAPVALIEDVLWGSLETPEQAGLLQRFLAAAASRGARSVSCPLLGYSSMAPLTAAAFRPSKRVLHAWLTLWNGLEPEPVSSLYIDVF